MSKKPKKLLKVIAIFILAMTWCVNSGYAFIYSSTTTYTDGVIKFCIATNNSAIVTAVNSSASTVEIPEYVTYQNVKREVRYIDIKSLDRYVKKLVLPSRVSQLGNTGSVDLPYLEELEFQSQGSFYGQWSFPNLKKLTLSGYITSISATYSPFRNNESLEEVEIKGNCSSVSIQENLFYGCKNLSRIVVNSASVDNSFPLAFPNTDAVIICKDEDIESELRDLNFQDSFSFVGCRKSENDMDFVVSTVTNEAFFDKNNSEAVEDLETVTIPELYNNKIPITGIMVGAFHGYPNLAKVEIPSSIKRILTNAFSDNPKLSVVQFNGGGKIGKYAFSNCPSLKAIRFADNITEIDDYAFANNSITEVLFGSGLKRIGKNAFVNNTTLTGVRFNENLELIDNSAFQGCSKLTLVNLNENLKSIGSSAFQSCSALSEIEIPSSCVTVGDNAFESCSNMALAILNEGVESIGANCFASCSALTSMSIPGTVTEIGTDAFVGCTSLSTLTLGAGPTTLGIPNFNACPLKTVRIGRNLNYTVSNQTAPFSAINTLTRVVFTGDYVTEVGSYLFYNCQNLASVTFNKGLKEIGDYTFRKCTSLKNANLTETVSSIGNYTFSDCTALESVSIPEVLQFIGDYGFYNCSSLKSVALPEGFTTSGTHCFDGCTQLTKVELPTTLEVISSYMFNKCRSLVEIEFKEGLKLISDNAFNGCQSLTGISIPSSVDNIEKSAFDKCTAISTLRFENSSNAITLNSTASLFESAPLTTMYVGRNISHSATTASKSPFYNQKKLTSVQFSENPDLTSLPKFFIYGASNVETIELPDNINLVDEYAFSQCTSLKAIRLSNNLKAIKKGCFQTCSMLASIDLPVSVGSVEIAAFDGCSSLASLRINDGTTGISLSTTNNKKGLFNETILENLYIGRNLVYSTTQANGYSPFYGLTTLKNVEFSGKGNVTRIDANLLRDCSSVQMLSVPKSVPSIGEYAFAGMSSLEECFMYNDVKTIGDYCFANDVSLKELQFSSGVETLNIGLFSGCSSLEKFEIFPTVKEVKEDVFKECSSLRYVKFADSNETIRVGMNEDDTLFKDSPLEDLYLGRWLIYSYSPFYQQQSLKTVTLSESVGDIGKELFYECKNLGKVDIPGVESIGNSAFYGCDALSDLTFHDGTRSIGSNAFAKCGALKNVKLPSTVTSVSDECFRYDENIVTLDLGNSLEIIGPNAFSDCSSLSEVTIPETVYALGVESFMNCKSLSYVNIPKGIKSVGARSFKDCTGLSSVKLSEKTTSLGVDCFKGCPNIMRITSMNLNPPVGLPGFSQNIIDNATLFVPESAIDDYVDSDLWWEFFSIKPVADINFISYLNIDKTEGRLKAAESLQLTANAGPDTADDTTVSFVSDNVNVASVDQTGLVTAHEVGEANIKAFAHDGSGYYKICKITVLPTAAEQIELSDQSIELRVNRTAELAAAVYPLTTTNKELTWKSSNVGVATVDQTGMIKAVYDGTAKITATAKDGSGVKAECIVKVLPPMKGDSNDNDVVNVSDVVNIANYALGLPTQNFNFRAADVNADNRITFADASATVTEILNQPLQNMMVERMRSLDQQSEIEDYLEIDNYDRNIAESTLGVKLNNTREYSALQADFVLPIGMNVKNVALGSRTESTHSITSQIIDDRTVRVVIVNFDNQPFGETEDAILELRVNMNSEVEGNIEVSNIVASDLAANEYSLYAVGGEDRTLTGISETGFNDISVYVANKAVNIVNAKDESISIFAADGLCVKMFEALTNHETVKLQRGVYVVMIGDNSTKIVVD